MIAGRKIFLMNSMTMVRANFLEASAIMMRQSNPEKPLRKRITRTNRMAVLINISSLALDSSWSFTIRGRVIRRFNRVSFTQVL